MTEWRNRNRHTGRRTYRPSLRIFPAGTSTIDKMKAIARWLMWLVLLCVIVIVIYKATGSLGIAIISLLPIVLKRFLDMIRDNSDDED